MSVGVVDQFPKDTADNVGYMHTQPAFTPFLLSYEYEQRDATKQAYACMYDYVYAFVERQGKLSSPRAETHQSALHFREMWIKDKAKSSNSTNRIGSSLCKSLVINFWTL